MVGSNDIARSKKFYDALFGALGGKPGSQDAKGRLIYVYNGGLFLDQNHGERREERNGIGLGSSRGLARGHAMVGTSLATGARSGAG